MQKIVHAGVHNTSFAGGSQDLRVLAGLNVPEKQVERLTKHIGQERVDQREHQVETFLDLPLMERLASPVAHPPDVAVVYKDGGRLQIMDRRSDSSVARRTTRPPRRPNLSRNPSSPRTRRSKPEEPAEGDQKRSGRRRENKIGLMMTVTSEESSEDPCPQIPESFVNPLRIAKLAREIKRGVLAADDAVAEASEDESENEIDDCTEYTPPRMKVKSMVGTRAEANGAETNWTIHKKWFREFVTIPDFTHALSYVYTSAMAGRKFRDGWDVYERWITLVWKGHVVEVIEELGKRGKQGRRGDEYTGERRSLKNHGPCRPLHRSANPNASSPTLIAAFT